MASLEALIRKRLMTDPRIEERLATYWEEPAIFLQEAPDDTAEGGEMCSSRGLSSSWIRSPMQSGV